MNRDYGINLDLNLLRVFVVVAEAGSVTEAADQLYVTQPAVSAALRRLTRAIGQPLFERAGRGLALTARGERLIAAARPHLEALVAAALKPAFFDPKTSDRVVRIGLSDANEEWLLPPLLNALAKLAPHLRLVTLPTQFRTVGEDLSSGRLDLAVTVADDLPQSTVRTPLFVGGFVCLFDPRRVRLPRKLGLERYLEQDHVVVSYNGDLRGIVEDFLGYNRRVRASVPSFQSVGAAVDGTGLLATVPVIVAHDVISRRRHLRTAELPFLLGGGTPMELLWQRAMDDDEALRFVRGHVVRIANAAARTAERALKAGPSRPRP
jgi:LysR family transcriptional regulator, mexEF-oprN operon transcriptional activator